MKDSLIVLGFFVGGCLLGAWGFPRTRLRECSGFRFADR